MMENFVFIHGDEWKKSDVAEQIEWAITKSWVKEKWNTVSENWDHDHCEICGWKLYQCDDPVHVVGYCNIESNNWICTECYGQFIRETK
ncbi:MAG: hypothetical protein GXP00_09490 [Alphaproteobacteria bacterium]|nr:hypothetical protein [Alphaproteobacteria bacterium]